MSAEVHIFASWGEFYLKPKSLKRTRRYEDKEYSFVASDISLECEVDADHQADAVYGYLQQGENISFVFQRDGVDKFRGTFISEGAKYDPEKVTYTFPIVHVIKNIFGAMASTLPARFRGLGYFNFGFSMLNDFFTQSDDFNVILDHDAFEFVQQDSKNDWNDRFSKTNVFENFLNENVQYTTADWWKDIAKHYRAIFYADDSLGAGYKPNLHLVPRDSIKKVHLNTDWKKFFAGYSEELKNPDYDAVYFPCYLVTNLDESTGQSGNGYYSANATFTRNGVLFEARFEGDRGYVQSYFSTMNFKIHLRDSEHNTEIKLPENTLDLRAPSGVYPKTLPDMIWFNHPFITLPVFTFDVATNDWVGESPLEYCNRLFKYSIYPYQEVQVLYSEQLPVNPYENIILPNGNEAKIFEIEDDDVVETTKITGRILQNP